MTPEHLLDGVHDRASFLAFVAALAAERGRTDKLEAATPDPYRLNGELGWNSADIPSFLDAAVRGFERHPDEPPSWRLFAEFLYLGKLYE